MSLETLFIADSRDQGRTVNVFGEAGAYSALVVYTYSDDSMYHAPLGPYVVPIQDGYEVGYVEVAVKGSLAEQFPETYVCTLGDGMNGIKCVHGIRERGFTSAS